MIEPLASILWITLFAVLGLLIGSFLNVCIYRLPLGLDIVRGHSFCPACKHPLGSLDLVPVISYLLLGQKCRYCKTPIPSRYAWIELLTGAYFALTAVIWRPQHFEWPDWLVWIDRNTVFDPTWLVATFSLLTFCALLVWSMILWDKNMVPVGVLVFAAVFSVLRLALQPERILIHLTGLLLALLMALILAVFRLLPANQQHERIQFSTGLGLVGLSAGLWAVQPVLGVLLVELLLVTLFLRKKDAGIRKQAAALWHSMPLQALLIASVALLFF